MVAEALGYAVEGDREVGHASEYGMPSLTNCPRPFLQYRSEAVDDGVTLFA
jgi:hypothetical protein